MRTLAEAHIVDEKLVRERWKPAVPTAVFDTYWRFAAERQSILFKRLGGCPWPWTTDTILQRHKFTNAYRAADRVSQYLIKHVIYKGSQSPEELFFRVVLFKLFNRIETWELLGEKVGPIIWRGYCFEAYDKALSEAMAIGTRIYSAAYIMPPGSRVFGFARKHRNHLKLVERMMEDEVPRQVSQTRSMQEAFELLRSYPTIGDFLAYQLVTDINYAEITDFSEMEFVAPGPGARDGIRKCFADLGGLTETEIIRRVFERQEGEFERLALDFQSLWGRALQFIDCQSLFCEVDKYARVAHPEVRGVSGRTRIKQRYRPKDQGLEYWFPPKWNLNEAVETWKRENVSRA